MDTTQRALKFLITTIFDIYIFILVLRVILSWLYVSYYQPLTQFVVKATDFVIKPLKTVIPNTRGIEVSTICLIYLLEIMKFLIITIIVFGVIPNIFGLIILGFAETINITILVFFYSILIHALLSWIQPNSPINDSLAQLNAPIIKPIQRIVPKVSGFDISPIPALILLQLLIIIIVDPLRQFGYAYL